MVLSDVIGVDLFFLTRTTSRSDTGERFYEALPPNHTRVLSQKRRELIGAQILQTGQIQTVVSI
jgi:hypothetical protein